LFIEENTKLILWGKLLLFVGVIEPSGEAGVTLVTTLLDEPHKLVINRGSLITL
jgi:hypothetical protein